MTKKLFSILSIFTFSLTSFGQHSFGLKTNVGLSYLTTRTELSSKQQVEQKFYPIPSGQIGFYYIFQITEKYTLGTELLFIPILGRERMTIFNTDINGNLNGDKGEAYYNRRIYNLGFPIYLGYNYNKMNFNIGIQTHYALASGGKEKGYAVINGSTSKFENQSKKLGINKLDYGLRAGIVFEKSDKLAFNGNYYFGGTNLIEDSSAKSFMVWKAQLLTFGITYKLIGRKKEFKTME
jgi:hypothetical protein